MSVGKLVFVRHGQSEWNKSGLFTGWVDVGLTDSGVKEALIAGEKLLETNIKFDIMYSSVLKRAVRTGIIFNSTRFSIQIIGNIILSCLNQEYIPVMKTWRLNERMYGALQGKNKIESVEKYGKEQILIWRRSFDVPPPPIEFDDQYCPIREKHKYGNLSLQEVPRTECLKDVIERVSPFFRETIIPKLKSGLNILVIAHGNSIRAICKYLDEISDQDVTSLEIPTGIPLLYTFEENLKPSRSVNAIPPLSAEFLVDQETLKASQEKVRQQLEKK